MLIRTLIDFSVYKQSCTKFLRIGTDDNETINETANNSLSAFFFTKTENRQRNRSGDLN